MLLIIITKFQMMNMSFTPLAFFFFLLSLLSIILNLLTPVRAESVMQSQLAQEATLANVTFNPPKDDKPDQTEGGASRGDICSQSVTTHDECVIPLMPMNHSGLTVAERPTFYVYIPKTSAKAIFFSLIDDTYKSYYQIKIPIVRKSGIIDVKIPKNIAPLEVGKTYYWTFIPIKDPSLRPDTYGVQGRVQRVQVNPILRDKIKNESLIKRAAIYGRNGIWFDTLISLAEARKSQPNDSDLLAQWEQLLKSVGLESLAKKPLLTITNDQQLSK